MNLRDLYRRIMPCAGCAALRGHIDNQNAALTRYRDQIKSLNIALIKERKRRKKAEGK